MEFETSTGPQPMCVLFRNYAYIVFAWVQVTSVFIIVLNFVLRGVCSWLIKWVRFKTETRRIAKVTKLDFITTFLNTAFIPLLISANLEEQPIPNHLTGPFNDFNQDWFRFTGNLLIATMILNAFAPIVEFVLDYVMRLWSRLRDSGFTLNRF